MQVPVPKRVPVLEYETPGRADAPCDPVPLIAGFVVSVLIVLGADCWGSLAGTYLRADEVWVWDVPLCVAAVLLSVVVVLTIVQVARRRWMLGCIFNILLAPMWWYLLIIWLFRE